MGSMCWRTAPLAASQTAMPQPAEPAAATRRPSGDQTSTQDESTVKTFVLPSSHCVSCAAGSSCATVRTRSWTPSEARAITTVLSEPVKARRWLSGKNTTPTLARSCVWCQRCCPDCTSHTDTPLPVLIATMRPSRARVAPSREASACHSRTGLPSSTRCTSTWLSRPALTISWLSPDQSSATMSPWRAGRLRSGEARQGCQRSVLR